MGIKKTTEAFEKKKEMHSSVDLNQTGGVIDRMQMRDLGRKPQS